MALLEQVVMIDQVALVCEDCQQGERPCGYHYQPGPDHRCPAAHSRSNRLLIVYVRQLHSAHRAPPVVTSPAEREYIRCLGFEVEVALNGIAPAELPDHTMLRNAHLVARGLGNVCR